MTETTKSGGTSLIIPAMTFFRDGRRGNRFFLPSSFLLAGPKKIIKRRGLFDYSRTFLEWGKKAKKESSVFPHYHFLIFFITIHPSICEQGDGKENEHNDGSICLPTGFRSRFVFVSDTSRLCGVRLWRLI